MKMRNVSLDLPDTPKEFEAKGRRGEIEPARGENDANAVNCLET